MKEIYERNLFVITFTIQIISGVNQLFFCWLGTKMELPDNTFDFWLYINLIAFGVNILGIILINKLIK